MRDPGSGEVSFWCRVSQEFLARKAGVSTKSDGYTYWEHDEYKLIQLLPPGDFVAVMFDDSETPWTLRTEPLLFIALANKITRFMRAPTKDRQNFIFSTAREYEDPLKEQTLVGIQFYLDQPLQIVDELANCLGIMPSTSDVVEFAKYSLTNEQIAMFQFDK